MAKKRSKVSSLKSRVRAKAAGMKNVVVKRAHAELSRAKGKFMAVERKVREQIRKNPEKAVAIAAAVGAALGIALMRVLRKKK